MLDLPHKSTLRFAARDNWLADTQLMSASLTGEERRALTAAGQWAPVIDRHAEIVREGAEVASVHVIVDGWACRYKTLPDGARHIVKLLVPGDIVNLDSISAFRTAYGVRALTVVRYISIRHTRLTALMDQHPGIMKTVLRLATAEIGVANRWAVILGRFSSEQRVAHLLCELSVRLAGNDDGLETFDLPTTQEQIGEAIGITSVHVNRTIRMLREEGLLVPHRTAMTLPDMPGLRRRAQFSPAYLQIAAAHDSPRNAVARAEMPPMTR